jgi:hypothetical protein
MLLAVLGFAISTIGTAVSRRVEWWYWQWLGGSIGGVAGWRIRGSVNMIFAAPGGEGTFKRGI